MYYRNLVAILVTAYIICIIEAMKSSPYSTHYKNFVHTLKPKERAKVYLYQQSRRKYNSIILCWEDGVKPTESRHCEICCVLQGD